VAQTDAAEREFALPGSDQELNAAASSEGLAVLDPVKQEIA
jgi:hypothetical protein